MLYGSNTQEKFIPLRIYTEQQVQALVKTYQEFCLQVEVQGLHLPENAELAEKMLATLVAMVEKNDQFSPTAGAMAQALYDKGAVNK